MIPSARKHESSTEELRIYTHVDPALIDHARGIWAKLNDDAHQQWWQNQQGPSFFLFALTPGEDDQIRQHHLGAREEDDWFPGYRLYRWACATEGLVHSLHQFLKTMPRTSVWVFRVS